MTIDTVAGGYGDGNPSTQSSFVTPIAIARDPLDRGIYVLDAAIAGNLIRFVNTSVAPVTIAGRGVAPGTVRLIAGGGFDPNDNIPGVVADLGAVTGLAVSPDGVWLYFNDLAGRSIRALNVSPNAAILGSMNIGSGNVGTLASVGLGNSVNGLAVHPVTGEIYVADATSINNRVFKISLNGVRTVFAGNGLLSNPEDTFSPGAATGMSLLKPRAIAFDPQGNLYIADTGHARVIKVDGDGNATLIIQFPPVEDNAASPYKNNPFTTGLTFHNGKLYLANGDTQDIIRVDAPGSFQRIAGIFNGTLGAGTVCSYQSGETCGDGGLASAAGLNLNGSLGAPPLNGMAANNTGIFFLDQGSLGRGRVRYVNLSGAPVTLAGITISAGQINTIAGNGFVSPHDGGLATSATLAEPAGVAVDANGNLWIADALNSRLRFVNRGSASVTLFSGTAAQQTVPARSIVTANKDFTASGLSGVPVSQAGLDTPQGVVATAQGIFLADAKKGPVAGNLRTGLIRFINTTNAAVEFYSSSASKVTVLPGHIATIVGGGMDESNVGDGANPLQAKLVGPVDVAVHPATGDIYVADAGQRRVRRIVSATGATSSLILPAGTNDQYTGLGFDPQGRLLVVNTGTPATGAGAAILREKFAGSGSLADGFDVLLAGEPLRRPCDVASDATGGVLYVTNSGVTSQDGHNILKITLNGSTGTATVIAGMGGAGFSGDFGPAENAQLNLSPSPFNTKTAGPPNLVQPTVNISLSATGEIIFADSQNNRIRRLVPVDNPAPVLANLSPSSANAGGAALILTVNGTNFLSGAKVYWNGAERQTNFGSAMQLLAQIPASDLVSSGAAMVTVVNPDGKASNGASFTIQPCTYTIQPAVIAFSAAGGVENVGVTTASGCGWTATSNAAWLTITSGALGSGNGTVSFSVAANQGAARSGTLTVAGQTFTVNQAAADPSPSGLLFHPLPRPLRLLDTRPAQQRPGPAFDTPGIKLRGLVTGGVVRAEQARVAFDGLVIPAEAKVIVGTASVINFPDPGQYDGTGNITFYPSGLNQPEVSHLNYAANQVVSNAFTVGLNEAGAFDIFAYSDVHLVIDVVGYYAPPAPGGLYYHPLPRPVRLLESRANPIFPGCDTPRAALIGNTVRRQAARVTCEGVTVPASAQVLVGNLTAVNATTSVGIATAYSGDLITTPIVTSLVYNSSQATPNAFVTKLGADGAFNLFVSHTTDFLVDVAGYFSPEAQDINGAGLSLTLLSRPVRLLETRSNPIYPGCDTPRAPLAGGSVREQLARRTCDGVTIPNTARTLIGNATVVNFHSPGSGNVTLFPANANRPEVSNLNYIANQVIPNAFTVGLNDAGVFSIYVFSTTDLLIDVTGYYSP